MQVTVAHVHDHHDGARTRQSHTCTTGCRSSLRPRPRRGGSTHVDSDATMLSRELLEPTLPPGQTALRPVGPAVNDARYDGLECLAAPVEAQTSPCSSGLDAGHDRPTMTLSSPARGLRPAWSSTSTAVSGSERRCTPRRAPRRSPRFALAGKGLMFLTNDARRAPEEYVRKLWGLGVQASLEEVLTVGAAIQHLLVGRGTGAATYVIGSQAIFRHVAESGQRIVNGTRW